MTDTPATPDDLLDLWAGTHAPAEPSPTIHPSMLPPQRGVIVRHAYLDIQINVRTDGSLEVRDAAGTWRIVAPNEVMALGIFKAVDVAQMRARPRAETPGADPERDATDPLRPARGICNGLIISAGLWALMFAAGWTIARLAGWAS